VDDVDREIRWATRHMPRVARAVAALPPLTGVRLALNVHLDVKGVPVVAGLLARGAAVNVTTCNPATVRDDVVARLRDLGATVDARRDMDATAWRSSIDDALAWEPTHVSEMGAAITLAAHRAGTPSLRAAQEITGSGIQALRAVDLRIPVVDVDAVPVKTELHNRHLVGFSAWHTFTERTHLTLHERTVLVVGCGPVGHGVAMAARARGACVLVCERDPARRLTASYDGFELVELEAGLARADIVATATGATGVIGPAHHSSLRDGCFLLNVGHHGAEIDVPALLAHPHDDVLPHVTAIDLGHATVHLLARGEIVNLAAGWGDGLNTFDLTLAVIVAGIGALPVLEVLPPGLHPLPSEVWRPVLAPVRVAPSPMSTA
jgi:adenosylhomocysteinase